MKVFSDPKGRRTGGRADSDGECGVTGARVPRFGDWLDQTRGQYVAKVMQRDFDLQADPSEHQSNNY